MQIETAYLSSPNYVFINDVERVEIEEDVYTVLLDLLNKCRIFYNGRGPRPAAELLGRLPERDWAAVLGRGRGGDSNYPVAGFCHAVKRVDARGFLADKQNIH
jgi:hypothetical protein